GGSMHRSMEKGMDTAIVTDMIHLAWEGQWDVAVLVSADGDFIPAVQFLHRTGRRVVHAGFAGQGTALARACWGSLDIAGTLHELDRTKNEPLDASRGHVTARARRRIASENRAFAPVGRVSLEEIRRKVSPEVRKTDPCPD
ncbi:MAG TPA: NYN domain-containing protein, partial [Polyangiaceae bacterium]|nr:NYN domain-containing protein [Polyangiaceae bacterium]